MNSDFFKQFKTKDIQEQFSSVLVRGGASTFVIRLAGVGLQFFLQLILAKILGVSDFGSYMYALAWVNVLVLIGKVGFDTSALRYVATYSSLSEFENLKGFVKQSTSIVTTVSIVTAAIFGMCIYIYQNYFIDDVNFTLLISSLLLPIFALLQVRSAILRGLGSLIRSLLPFSSVRHLVLISLLLILHYMYELKITPELAMILTIISAGISLLLLTYWLMKRLTSINDYKTFQPNYQAHEWVRTSLSMMGIASFQIILGQADIIIVGILLGSSEAGIYAVMSQISIFVLFGLQSVNTVLAPMLASLYFQKKHEHLQQIISISTKLIFILTIMLGGFVIFFGQEIISLFGEDFSVGYSVLIILVCGHLINAFAGPAGYLMTMTNNQVLSSKVLGVSAVVNIILNILLVPLYGMVGAAIATAITTIGWNITLVYFSKKILGISTTVFQLGTFPDNRS